MYERNSMNQVLNWWIIKENFHSPYLFLKLTSCIVPISNGAKLTRIGKSVSQNIESCYIRFAYGRNRSLFLVGKSIFFIICAFLTLNHGHNLDKCRVKNINNSSTLTIVCFSCLKTFKNCLPKILFKKLVTMDEIIDLHRCYWLCWWWHYSHDRYNNYGKHFRQISWWNTGMWFANGRFWWGQLKVLGSWSRLTVLCCIW